MQAWDVSRPPRLRDDVEISQTVRVQMDRGRRVISSFEDAAAPNLFAKGVVA